MREKIAESFLQVLQQEKRALDEITARFQNENDNIVAACQTVLELLKAYQNAGRVIVSGIGKAGLVAKKIGATMSSTGTAAVFLHPVEGLHGDLGFVKEGDCGLLLSYSGETVELVRLAKELQRIGCPLVALTKTRNSTLGKIADVCIEIGEINEACYMGLAPSSSTTVMMAIGDALALTIAEMNGFQKEDFGKNHPAGSLGLRFRATSDMMRPKEKVVCLPGITPLKEAVEKVSQAKVGAAILINEDKTLHGIFTDGDLRRALLKGGGDALERPVEDFASIPCLYTYDNESIAEALKLLQNTQTKELPVVSRLNKAVVGLLCLNDIGGY